MKRLRLAEPYSGQSRLLKVDGSAIMPEFAGSSAEPREGEVIALREGSPIAEVLYEPGAKGNVLFLTERCNSFCLMCSQPPRNVDDRWRIDQALALIDLIDRNESYLTITGGEPTLNPAALLDVLAKATRVLPDTEIHILSNGRQIGRGWLKQLRKVGSPRISWGIPLYADVPEQHDYVVQSKNAFFETLDGLYALGMESQRVEIRVVLHRQTVERLVPLAEYIYRNLTFVEHVALMGIEPTGFARANYETLWIDPLEYVDQLSKAVHFLDSRGVACSVYNLPLCILPADMRPFATQSISDWKNVYLDQCNGCVLKPECAGFFASLSPQWISAGVEPVTIRTRAAP